METRTYNTIVTSKELEVLNNDNKQNFYTSNGWQGSKYDIKVKELVEATKLSESVSNSDNHKKKRGKSLQDIIDQTRRLNGHAGRNWYWNFKREKLINKIYTIYVANIQKLGAFSEPEKKFTREEYSGITPTFEYQEKPLDEDKPASIDIDVKIFDQNDLFFKIVKRLRDNLKKGHSAKTIYSNIRAFRNLVHDVFFRSVTVPYFSKPQDCPKVNRELVTEFLRRVDYLAKGDDLENGLMLISRYCSIFNTMEEITKEKIASFCGETEISQRKGSFTKEVEG